MQRGHRDGRSGIVATAVAVLVATAACTSSGGPGAGGPVGQQSLDRATHNLAPFTGHPNPFPVDQPLTKRPAAGSTLAYLQCATAICALLARTTAEAAGAMGMTHVVTKAGPSAQALQDAMSSIIARKPAAILIPAADPVQYREPMTQLASLNIPVISQGVVDTDQFPAIKGEILGRKAADLAGVLLADWVVKRNGTSPSVFYNTPELSFAPFIVTGFKREMAAVCPSCSLRFVDVPVATIGNRAPSTVVSDLQAHPDTKTVVFASEEAANGLPAALKVAGIDVDTVGFAPDPVVLGYIRDGSITAGLGFDIRTTSWVQVDMAARVITGEPLTAAERDDPYVMQMLEQGDITFDPTRGWNGYPDVAARFGKLWTPAGGS